MPWIYRLERKLGRRFGIPNLILYITATQLAVYVMTFFFLGDQFTLRLMLYWPAVMEGEVWRLITFLIIPPVQGNNILLLLLVLYATYHIGTALESAWSTMLFTLFYVIEVFGAILGAAITRFGSNGYIPMAMFLAYAYLYPDATFMVFYLLPVKAKWLALIDWVFFGALFIMGNAAQRVGIVLALAAFFCFFGPNVWRGIKQNFRSSRRRREFRKNWGNDNPWR